MRAINARRTIGLISTPLISLCGALATAQSVPPSVQACRSESGDAQRLQCYDREIGKLLGPSSTPAPTGPALTTSAPPAATAPASNNFGFTNSEAKAAEQHVSVGQVQQQEQKRTLTATVSALSVEAHGVFTVTLDNGQVWRQLEAEGTGFAVGDQITIKPGLLGSYLLIAPHRWSTKVHRLK